MTFICKLSVPYNIKSHRHSKPIIKRCNDENKAGENPHVLNPKRKKERWIRAPVWRRSSGSDSQLIQCRGLTKLPPPDPPRPKDCGGLMEGRASPPPTLISFRLVLSISIKYCFITRLSTHRRPAYLAAASGVARHSSSLALTLTFAHLARLSWVKQSNLGDCYPPGFCLAKVWGECNKERNAALTSKGIIPMLSPFTP